MLSELYIKNYALIDELRINFDGGLNIITGETGSGKSIMIDALSLALGKKASKNLVRKNQKKAIIEAVFCIDTSDISAFMDKLGIDNTEDQVIVAREITEDGRSFSRINGRAVNQADLRSLTSRLLTIHGQNEYEQILNQSNQLKLIDRFAGAELEDLLSDYTISYNRSCEIKKNILRLNDNMDEAMLQREISLIEYEINEITKAKVERGERKHLKERLSRAENLEYISSNLHFA